MARAQEVINLIRLAVEGNTFGLRQAARALAANERARGHRAIAVDIERLLAEQAPPAEGLMLRNPKRRFAQMYLEPGVVRACEELVEEHKNSAALLEAGLEPRHRMLLVGPPGNGKTSLAECVAAELDLPLYVVQYEAISSSFLGETSKKLRALFESPRPSVLFFDEFDAVGKERGDSTEVGEVKRVVAHLLLNLDDLPWYVVFIGASNHAELLDRAVWRRFQIRLALRTPKDAELKRYFTDRMAEWPQGASSTASDLARRVRPANYSEAEDFCMNVRRALALNAGAATDEVLENCLQGWAQRVRPEEARHAAPLPARGRNGS